MAQQKNKATSRLDVKMVFEDRRFANLAITWQVGTNKLLAVSKGGPTGPLVVDTMLVSGGIKDYEQAAAEAEKWFDALPEFYDDEPSEEWSE